MTLTINQKDAIKEALSPISESELEQQFNAELKGRKPVDYDQEFIKWLDSKVEIVEIDGQYYDTEEVEEIIDSFANEEE